MMVYPPKLSKQSQRALQKLRERRQKLDEANKALSADCRHWAFELSKVGGMSTRWIADHIGVSHQRVAQWLLEPR